MSSSSLPLLTVIGATGLQGGSVIDAVLPKGSYRVRAVTRNTKSESARALASRAVEVVAADLNDEESLAKALEGSTAIFAVTNFFEPFMTLGATEAYDIEVRQGISLARAASRLSTLKHYIWSTLPNTKAISGGKFNVPHLDSKAAVDGFIRTDLPELLAKTTFFWVSYYAQNFFYPCLQPTPLQAAGKHVLAFPVGPDTPVQAIGDARKNVGVFVQAILAKPELTKGGKHVLVSMEETTTGGLLQTWEKATGKEAVYIQISVDDYDKLWPTWGYELGTMLQFWESAGSKSWSGGEVLTRHDLQLDNLVGTAAFLETNKSAF